MSDQTDRTSQLRDRIESMIEDLERHVRVLDSIEEEPDDYDDDEVVQYTDKLDEGLDGATFLDDAESAMAPLEEAVEEAEQEFLENARVIVDDREIEGVELLYVESDEAAVLVESPKVNQLRGGAQLLELEDGRQFEFAVDETLVADVAEDKTGDLKLVLSLQEL
jgi:hypothetical protein